MRLKRLALRTRYRVLLSPFSLGVLLVKFRFRALPRPRFLETKPLKFERAPLRSHLTLRKTMFLKLLGMLCRMSFRKFFLIASFSLKGPKLLGNFGMESSLSLLGNFAA